MIYLDSLDIRASKEAGYPLSLPLFENTPRVEFTKPVCILCGENGSGKTTLLELLAAKLKALRIGKQTRNEKQTAFNQAARLCKITQRGKYTRCFYFSAEDFSRYLDDLHRMKEEARQELAAVERDYKGRSAYARSQGSLPFQRALAEIDSQYSRSLEESSHGEGFLSFFQSRILQKGLYLMDEPEGALSYANQLSLMALMDIAIKNESQIIMATHSPVLSSFPGAQLLSVTGHGLEETTYDRLDSLSFLNYYLRNREKVLQDAGIDGKI